MAKGPKGSEAARAPDPFPCATMGWAVLPLLLDADGQVPSHFGTGPHTPWVWSQSMFKAGSLSRCCCRCEGEFGDKINGSPACSGL